MIDTRWEKYSKELDKLDLSNDDWLNSPIIQRIIVSNNNPYNWVQYWVDLDKFNEIKSTNRDVCTFVNTAMCLYQLRLMFTNLNYDCYNKTFAPKTIEIGAGYGNLCRLFKCFFPITHYTIVDTPSMGRLSNHFLGQHKVSFEFWTNEQISQMAGIPFDLFISSFCLSETPKDYCDYVLYNIALNCNDIFIIDGGKGEEKFIDYLTNFLYANFDDVKIKNYKCHLFGLKLFIAKKKNNELPEKTT